MLTGSDRQSESFNKRTNCLENLIHVDQKMIVFEKWGLVLLVTCLLTVFGLSVHEGMKPKEGTDAILVWTYIVETSYGRLESVHKTDKVATYRQVVLPVHR